MKKINLWLHLGPGKSGSTWIYNIAKKNKDLFSVPLIKETQNFHTSSEFQSKFYKKDVYSNGRIICDFSNTYFFNPLCLKNIKDFSETNKIKFNVLCTTLLRCPIKRAVSHYKYIIASGESRYMAFENFLVNDPSFLWRSRYEIHSNFISSIDLNCVNFILEEQNKKDPEIIKYVSSYFERENTSMDFENIDQFGEMTSRNYLLSYFGKKVSKRIRESNQYELLESIKSNKFVNMLFKKKSKLNFILPQEFQEELKLYFSPTKDYFNSKGLNVSKWLI